MTISFVYSRQWTERFSPSCLGYMVFSRAKCLQAMAVTTYFLQFSTQAVVPYRGTPDSSGRHLRPGHCFLYHLHILVNTHALSPVDQTTQSCSGPNCTQKYVGFLQALHLSVLAEPTLMHQLLHIQLSVHIQHS